MTIEELLRFDWLQLRVSTVLWVSLTSIAVISVVTLFWRGNNRLAALDSRCTTAAADVDAQLKHRHNLIPGFVETVRGYVGHENEVLIAVAQANAEALRASNLNARLDAEVQLGSSINTLLQTVQKYPELKASGHFQDVQRQLIDVENRVTAARRFLNLATEEYNTQLGHFPSNIVARLQKRSPRAAYSLGEAQRAEVDAPFAFKF